MIIKDNVSLRPYNTFGIEAKAAKMAVIECREDLFDLINMSFFRNNKRFILGGGSNLLFRKDFDGLIITVDIKNKRIVENIDDSVVVETGAGENWHGFVTYCVENNLSGLENLALIPGKTGAAPVQNIGAYGAEQKDAFLSLEGIDIQTGNIKEMYFNDCVFAYRNSIFKDYYKDNFIISSVRYKLSKKPNPNLSYKELKNELERKGIFNPGLMDIYETVCDIRLRKLPDPEILGNAGSFFKNPVIPKEKFEELKAIFPNIVSYPAGINYVKVSAGWLIDMAGWKGFRQYDAGVSEKHALILVNYGSASGEDIYNLSEMIINDVENKTGIRLEREVLVV